MHDDPHAIPPQIPRTPPTVPGEIRLPTSEEGRGTRVIGILMIVFGSLSILTNVCSVIQQLVLPRLMGQFGSSSTQGATQSQFQAMSAYSAPMAVLGMIQVAAGALCLVAGILVVQKLRTGIVLARAWGVLKILVSIVGAGVGIAFSRSFTSQMMSQPGGQGMPAGMGPFMMILQIGGAIFGFLIATALPIVALVWFSRAKIKREVDEWR